MLVVRAIYKANIYVKIKINENEIVKIHRVAFVATILLNETARVRLNDYIILYLNGYFSYKVPTL